MGRSRAGAVHAGSVGVLHIFLSDGREEAAAVGQATLHRLVHQVEPGPRQGGVRAAFHSDRGEPQVLVEAKHIEKMVGVHKEKIKK